MKPLTKTKDKSAQNWNRAV